MARTEAFTAGQVEHGSRWGEENAKNYMAGPAQSMQWSVARETGTVAIPEHIEQEYANRPAPTGFGGYHGPGSKMTKRDWSEA